MEYRHVFINSLFRYILSNEKNVFSILHSSISTDKMTEISYFSLPNEQSFNGKLKI